MICCNVCVFFFPSSFSFRLLNPRGYTSPVIPQLGRRRSGGHIATTRLIVGGPKKKKQGEPMRGSTASRVVGCRMRSVRVGTSSFHLPMSKYVYSYTSFRAITIAKAHSASRRTFAPPSSSIRDVYHHSRSGRCIPNWEGREERRPSLIHFLQSVRYVSARTRTYDG